MPTTQIISAMPISTIVVTAWTSTWIHRPDWIGNDHERAANGMMQAIARHGCWNVIRVIGSWCRKPPSVEMSAGVVGPRCCMPWMTEPERRNKQVFFFQAEDGIRDYKVTGVQTCALPI